MFRATSDPTAPFVDLALTPGHGVRLGRPAVGVQPSYIQGPTLTGPVWLKLTRQGSTFTGFVSSDGVNYTTLGSFVVSMASNVLSGLAVTSRNPGLASTATFDNVSVAPANTPTNPATPTNLTAMAKASSQINLSWTDTAGDAQQFLIEQSTDGTTFTQVGIVGATARTYSAANLQASTTYTFRVRASNAGLYSGASRTRPC